MATLATTNIKHASSSSNNIVLNSDGTTYIPGHIIQVVSGDTSSAASTTDSTFVDTNLTATITPTSTSSKIYVIVNQSTTVIHTSSSHTYHGLRLIRTVGGTSTTLHEPVSNNGSGPYDIGGLSQVMARSNINILDIPNTISAITYKTQMAQYANNVGTLTAQYSGTGGGTATNATSYITLMEIAA
tara:strand:- start:966 stop:1523 length:558 start_codon:yes stop_codon:yes gene_type:complete